MKKIIGLLGFALITAQAFAANSENINKNLKRAEQEFENASLIDLNLLNEKIAGKLWLSTFSIKDDADTDQRGFAPGHFNCGIKEAIDLHWDGYCGSGSYDKVSGALVLMYSNFFKIVPVSQSEIKEDPFHGKTSSSKNGFTFYSSNYYTSKKGSTFSEFKEQFEQFAHNELVDKSQSTLSLGAGVGPFSRVECKYLSSDRLICRGTDRNGSRLIQVYQHD